MPDNDPSFKAAFRRHDVQIAGIVVVMVVLFSAISPGFLSAGNVVSLLENYSVMAIMASGLLVVLISGGIDISFAAIAAVSQYLVATLLVHYGGNWLVAFGLAALFGVLLGVVNALLIYYLKALSVIVTISTMTFYFAVLMFVTDGKSIYNLPDWFTMDLSLFGIPFPVVVAAVVLFVTVFFTNAAKEGGLNIVASQPANWNRKKAVELATNILERDPNLKAIFAANDDMALGVARAVQATGATGKIIVVSVDGTPDAIDALKQGLLAGTVAQYPDAMAYMAIETLVKNLNGETVPEKISSPIKLITKDNVSDAGKYYKDELDLSSNR